MELPYVAALKLTLHIQTHSLLLPTGQRARAPPTCFSRQGVPTALTLPPSPQRRPAHHSRGRKGWSPWLLGCLAGWAGRGRLRKPARSQTSALSRAPGPGALPSGISVPPVPAPGLSPSGASPALFPSQSHRGGRVCPVPFLSRRHTCLPWGVVLQDNLTGCIGTMWASSFRAPTI